MAADDLSRALQRHQAGDLATAEAEYRRILASEPENAAALHYLGVCQLQQGRTESAAQLLRRSVELDPGVAAAQNHLGAVQAMLGGLQEAIQCFRRAIALDPLRPDTHYNLGSALAKLNEKDEALASYREAIRLRPSFAEAHFNLANELFASGRLDEAIAGYEAALRARPEFPKAKRNLGSVLVELGNQLQQARRHAEAVEAFRRAAELRGSSAETWAQLGMALAAARRDEDAIAAYERAIELRPDFSEAFLNLGVCQKNLGHLREAEENCRRALRMRPDLAEAHCNLGVTLTALDRNEEAVASCREAQRLKPDFVEAMTNEGVALARLGQCAEAASVYERALALQPDEPDALYNLGHLLQHDGKYDEALDCFHRALVVRPDYAEARVARAMVWLARGDFERGWSEYEWRWKCAKFIADRLSHLRWDGSPDGTILIRCEQGFGDAFHFARYAALVKRRMDRVLFECPRPLCGILASCPGIDQIIPQGEPWPAFDVGAPLLSLPGIVGTTLATIPAQVPYLFADQRLVEHWRQRLSEFAGFKIGVSWHARHEQIYARSFPLAELEAIAAIPGVRLFSLQKKDGLEQLAPAAERFRIDDFGDELDEDSGPFMDTAAVMKCLDLVISCDSAVAHLAGGLGVETWLALPQAAEWRWLVGREDSPWYPGHRLFRRTAGGDWDTVFARMKHELLRLPGVREGDRG